MSSFSQLRAWLRLTKIRFLLPSPSPSPLSHAFMTFLTLPSRLLSYSQRSHVTSANTPSSVLPCSPPEQAFLDLSGELQRPKLMTILTNHLKQNAYYLPLTFFSSLFSSFRSHLIFLGVLRHGLVSSESRFTFKWDLRNTRYLFFHPLSLFYLSPSPFPSAPPSQ